MVHPDYLNEDNGDRNSHWRIKQIDQSLKVEETHEQREPSLPNTWRQSHVTSGTLGGSIYLDAETGMEELEEQAVIVNNIKSHLQPQPQHTEL